MGFGAIFPSTCNLLPTFNITMWLQGLRKMSILYPKLTPLIQLPQTRLIYYEQLLLFILYFQIQLLQKGSSQ